MYQLGESIPSNITTEIYAEEVAQVKNLLNGPNPKSRQDLLSLPKMSDYQKLAAMQFYNHCLSMSFVAEPLLNPLLVFRMVKMSIEHGITNISAFAFACYGAWLVSEPHCDIEEGHLMGRVAIEMMKRLEAVEMIPRLYATVYGFINIWKEPWQSSQSKHLEAYESGARTGNMEFCTMIPYLIAFEMTQHLMLVNSFPGDMEYASTNLYQYINTGIYGCGENLTTIAETLQTYIKRVFQCGQRNSWVALIALVSAS